MRSSNISNTFLEIFNSFSFIVIVTSLVIAKLMIFSSINLLIFLFLTSSVTLSIASSILKSH